MTKKSLIYWYKQGPEFEAAFLYHLRDDDVQAGGRIPQGSVVAGKVGYVAAEAEVFGWNGKSVPFQPTRRCEWQGFELPCMAHPGIPAGKRSSGELRPFNYAVAAVTSEEVAQRAAELGVRVVETSEGKRVINVELARFERQGPERRATLLT